MRCSENWGVRCEVLQLISKIHLHWGMRYKVWVYHQQINSITRVFRQNSIILTRKHYYCFKTQICITKLNHTYLRPRQSWNLYISCSLTFFHSLSVSVWMIFQVGSFTPSGVSSALPARFLENQLKISIIMIQWAPGKRRLSRVSESSRQLENILIN